MVLSVTGVEAVIASLREVAQRVEGLPERLAQEMAGGMREVVHVQTGYLMSTIHSEGPYAIADAPYAGYEADRGGSHDFPALAMQNLDVERLADWLVERV